MPVTTFTILFIPFLLSGRSNINQNISLPQFDLRVNFFDNYATDYYDLSYPGVIMRIVLSRKMSFHLWQTYIPSSMFVVVAWLSTFVPPEEEKSCTLISLINVGPTLTDFEKFHPPQNKNPLSTFIEFLDFSTLHSSFIRVMY